jgi:hypothetical protein
VTFEGEVVASASTHVPQDGAGVAINDEPLLDTKPYVYSTPASRACHAHRTTHTAHGTRHTAHGTRHTAHGTHTTYQGWVA